MEWILWEVALILAQLKTRLDFLHGQMEIGALEENPLNVISSVKRSMIPHPSLGASGNSFPSGTLIIPFPPVTSGDPEGSPLITKLKLYVCLYSTASAKLLY